MTLVAWTVDRTDELKRLWAGGYTCSQIAAAIGGTTRNAVIGKVGRLGLQGRRSGNASTRKFHPRVPKAPQERAPRIRKRYAAPVRPILLPEEIQMRVAAVAPLHVTLTEIEPGQCRYPYGDHDFTFCGHPKSEDSSYCPAHHDLCRGRGTASERAASKISPLLVSA